MGAAAILVTGGLGPDPESEHSAEVLRSDGSPWCSLPDLPGPLDPSLGWTLTQDSDSTACLDN